MDLRSVNCAELLSLCEVPHRKSHAKWLFFQEIGDFNMPITQRCNYAGPLGKLIPTRSLAFVLYTRLRGALPGLRR
jgi:hypothetical protein